MTRLRSEVRLLKPREAAALLQVSPSTFREWCQRGLLMTIPTAGGHNRVPDYDPRIRAAMRLGRPVR
jgi:predicted site-specific integrase-resolvase